MTLNHTAPAYTAGPWETRNAVQPDNTGGFDIAIVADGGIIAEAFKNIGYGPDGRTYKSTPVEANARLIAAAPELLSIVERFIALPSGAWHPERHAADEAELMTDAAAVIAKAKGGAA